MNTRTLTGKLRALEKKRKDRDDNVEVKIRTCWGHEPIGETTPDTVVIRTVWGTTKLDRDDSETEE